MNEINLSDEDIDLFNLEIEDDILFYGFLNYVDNKTKEPRIYITPMTDDIDLVAMFINNKMKEKNISPIDFELKYALYEEEYFKILSQNGIYINKNLSIQKYENENVFYDYDNIFLLKTITILPENMKKNDPQFNKKLVEEKPTIIIEPLYLNEVIDNNYGFCENYFSPCPIIDSYGYEEEMDNFVYSEEYLSFDKKIELLFLEIQADMTPNEEDFNFILEDFIRPNLGEKWNQQLNILRELVNRNDLFLTVVNHEIKETGTFGQDNKYELGYFIMDCIKKLKHIPEKPISFSIVIRHFTNTYINKKDPEKNVGACILSDNGIFPLSKKDIMDASLKCHETGRKIKKEKTVTYVSFNKLLNILKDTKKETIH